MDKRMYAIERDIDNMVNLNNKKTIVDILKKKTSLKEKQNKVMPIEIHSNIYRLAKNRVS